MPPPGAGVIYHADYAWLGGPRVAENVQIDADHGRIVAVTPGVKRAARVTRLRGLTLPGMANTHSHAFHRALRGRTHRAGGSFWTWREDMYAVAATLTPDSYYELARATYAEMVLAGITCVGEFNYLHHELDGTRYSDPNTFGEVLIRAAADAGIRITLIDTCYLAGGIGAPLAGPQLRFGDGDALAWGERAAALKSPPHARIGAAIHSVRAVPADQLSTVASWAHERSAPLHFHVSEQRAENEACLAAHGRSPVALLEEHGALGAGSCAVHATHLDAADIAALGSSQTSVCICPTTERDLADGIGPARALADGGAALALGSDSNAVIDLFEEARALELDERLASERRGHWSASELLRAATVDGHAALGWPDAGRIEPGARADLVSVSLDSVHMAGSRQATMLESLLFAAAGGDVNHVVADGRLVVYEGRHVLVEDLPSALDAAISAVLP